MANTSRRSFFQTVAVTSAAFSIPRIAIPNKLGSLYSCGTGLAGYEYEGRQGLIATETPVNNPYGVVIGPGDDLYFCEVDTGRTRRLNLTTNRLTTIAGNGETGYIHESRRPLETSFNAPHEFSAGINKAISTSLNVIPTLCVALLLKQDWLKTLAGNGEPGDGGDGRPHFLSQLNRPHSIAFDSNGNLLICDIGITAYASSKEKLGLFEFYQAQGREYVHRILPHSKALRCSDPPSIDPDPRAMLFSIAGRQRNLSS
ncbi:MAG: hypothetical protein Ct9H300mP22_7280 [Gammaproteobacteria bacterium]|nr:MAG: hypothetical protein Ct9H300mP22_7280 [Gammaproteobacteria bacterium]